MKKLSHYAKAVPAIAALLMIILTANTGLGAPLGQGSLEIIEPDGKPGPACPLKHTSVKAEISGFVTRVEVKQVFHNPRDVKIEAIYTFPLSANAAVDDMTMRVGDRVVRGIIKRREEARRIYEQARDRGRVASLLDQERPNIFTQSVANIMPGEKVEITIKYVETLNYDDGYFKFVFPMVVAPRFIPGLPSGKQGTGWAPDTTSVPDASRITPPVAEKGKRAGHDIDLTVSIDAGVPIEKVESKLHEVTVDRKDKKRVTVSLKNKKEIPNRDFVLKYLVAADKVRSGVLAHKDGKNGYLTVIMIPPRRVNPEKIAPRELIFVVDTSGSQRGKPLAKAKKTMRYVIDRMNPNDTFNFIDFSNNARMLFSAPKKNTPENRSKALRYIDSLQGTGGTQMIPAVWQALSTPAPENRLRIVTFMTDGMVGNDFEIISMVKRLRDKSRWFPFGTGNSVNRFLLDNLARVGGGEVEYILLNSPGEEVAKKFYKRIASPVLTDISLSFEGVTLKDVYPSVVSDLWSRKPLIFKARYSKSGKGTIKIKGFAGGRPYEQTLDVNLPDKETENASLASLWARAKVDDLMDQDLMGIQRRSPKKEVKEQIIKVALAHRILTQFTSFVAVEEAVVTVGGKPTKVTVPVEMPDGVSREGIFGADKEMTVARQGRHIRSKAKAGSWFSGVLPSMRKMTMGSTRGVSPHKRAPQPAASAPSEARPHEPMNRTFEGRPAGIITSKDEISEREDRTKFAAIARKLSPDLYKLVRMKDKPRNYSKGKILIKDGKLTVQVWLTRISDDILKKLKEKGLKISFKASTGKLVIGEVDLDKLEELSKIKEIRLIEPFVKA